MYLHLLSLVLLTTCSSVYGQFSNGATSAECDTLAPTGTTPATGNAPFIVAVTSSSYTPGGNNVSVFIASAATLTATGLVLQARRASTAADNTPVGSFIVPSDGLYQLLQCGSSSSGTITNTNTNDKTLPLTFTWTPPATNWGPVEFIVSLTDSDGNFWSNEVSTTSLSSSEGELTALTTATCPQPTVANNVATWTAPNCLRGTEVQDNSATCDPPSGSTFQTGTNTIECTCSDRAETATCEITLIITAVSPCSPNPCDNGGTCIEVAAIPSGFFCQCPAGFPQPTCTAQNTAPTANCPASLTATALQGQTSASVQYSNGQCSDTQDGTFAAVCTPSSGSQFNIGTNPVTCSCTDSGGLQDTCTFIVTVSAFTAVGPCSPNPCNNGGTCIPVAALPSGFFCQCPAGFNQPTCTSDAQNTAPTANCPASQTATALQGQTSASVQYSNGQCSDTQDGTFAAVCTPSSGSLFNIGTNPVTCSCTDSGGLQDTCTFIVTVSAFVQPGGACDGDPCSGNECRESATSLAGYTCHSVFGTPCQQL